MIPSDTIKKLATALKPISEETEADAAVAILLKPINEDLQVLFIKRVENPRDPWSGQIALPGGKRDVKDQNLKQTISREVREETSINVLDCCRFLGTLAIQRSTPRPYMRILPFVILVEHELIVKLCKGEIESYAWIGLEELQKHRGVCKFNYGERNAYIIGNYIIWGMTYRILENLISILQQ